MVERINSYLSSISIYFKRIRSQTSLTNSNTMIPATHSMLTGPKKDGEMHKKSRIADKPIKSTQCEKRRRNPGIHFPTVFDKRCVCGCTYCF